MRDMDHNWSHLLPEILHIILQMLSLPDCFMFGAVCKSWLSVFLEKRSLSRPPPCLLRISKDLGTMDKQQLWIFHGGKFMMLHSPRSGIRDSEYIIGSSMGWLVIGSAKVSGLWLLNSLTGERIPLPPVYSGENHTGNKFGYTYFEGLHVILSSPPSSLECVIVAVGNRGGHDLLSICKPRGQVWITTRCRYLPKQFPTRNILFYEGELYVLGEHGDILIYEYNSEPRISFRRSIPCIGSGKLNQSWVVSGEEFFSVVWKDEGNHEVFKLTSRRDGTWLRVECLGDLVFIFGNHAAESFHIQDLMGSGFEANCIYYFVNLWLNKQMMKFSVASNRIEYFRTQTCFEWFTPHSW